VNVWGIVPVKSLVQAKSRLAAVLSPAEREGLSREMLLRTLCLLQDVRGLSTVSVVSGDPAALEIAALHQVRPIKEVAPAGLNPALTQAAAVAVQAQADVLLIVPIDLPLARPADIESVLMLVQSPLPAVVLVPDGAGAGTNLMAMRPPTAIPFSYGPDSFDRHRAASLARGIAFHTVHNPRLAWDVDTPADLASLPKHFSLPL